MVVRVRVVLNDFQKYIYRIHDPLLVQHPEVFAVVSPVTLIQNPRMPLYRQKI